MATENPLVSSQGEQLDGPQDALPDLSAAWQEKKEVLQALVPDILAQGSELLSAECQESASDKVLGICRECLLSIQLAVASANEANLDARLQSMRPLLDVLSECQQTASAFLIQVAKWRSEQLLDFDSVCRALALSLTLAKDALHHCQESGTAYGLLFSPLESELLNVFLKSYNSLKVSFTHLEQLVAPQDCVQEVLLDVWKCLQDVAAVSVHFDNTLMVKSWRHLLKFYGKVNCDNKTSMEVHASLLVLAETLVDRLRNTITSVAANQAQAQSGASPIKVVTFLASALMSLLQNCSGLDDSHNTMLLDMVLLANSCTAVLYRSTPTDSGTVGTLLATVKQVTSAVLKRLVETWSEMLPSLVEMANDENGDKLLGVFHCTLWFFQNFADLPGDVRDQLIQPAMSSDRVESSQFPLLELLFQVLPHCQVEFNLSSAYLGMASGSQQHHNSEDQSSLRLPSLYQHTFDGVTAFAVSLSSREFMACLEWGLLQQVVDAWHPVCVLLSSDLFLFLSRLGTPSLRVSYAIFLVKLVHSLPASLDHGYTNLTGLTRRIFASLTEKECTVALDRLSSISAEECSVVWSLLDFSKLPEGKLMQITPGLVLPAVRYLTYWQQHSSAQPAELVCAVELVTNLCRDDRCFQAMPADQRSVLCRLLLQLWQRMTEYACDADASEASQRVCQLLLEWSTLMVPILSSSDMLSLLLLYNDHLLACSQPDIVAGLPSIISAWGGRAIPDEQQEEVLGLMGNLCCTCLSSRHWRIHQAALVAFTAFAKVTPYADAVETKFLPDELSDAVVSYLQQIPHDASLISSHNVDDLSRVLKDRQQIALTRRQLIEVNAEPYQHQILRSSMKDLSSGLDAVSRFLDSTGNNLPAWLSSQLTSAHHTTKQLLDKVTSIRECAEVESQIVTDDDQDDSME